ncbi:unnamed protein product [Ascophyllum nodosum]
MKQRTVLAAVGSITFAVDGSIALLISSPPLTRWTSRHVRTRATSCSHGLLGATRMAMLKGGTDSDGDVAGETDLSTRQGWLQAAAAVATQAGVVFATSPGRASAEGAPKGLPASGYFVQHAVFKVENMDDEVKFYTEGLGMKVVRQREVNGARNVFVSYGEESLKVKDGGEPQLFLVYDPKAPRSSPSGGPFQYLGLTLSSTAATVAYKVDAAGGAMVPHWFGTKDFVEATSPGGTTVRVKEGKRRDPISVVAFATQYSDKARAYFHDVLGMKDLDQGMLKLLGPLAGEANRLLGYDRDGVAVALNPVDSKIYEGGRFGKLAVLTKDTAAVAAKVSASGGAKGGSGGDVLFAGEVPGIGTKVANTIDFEGRGVVFVDYDDFEGEMAPSSQ